MIRKTRLAAAAFVLGAGLTAAGVALAQTQSGSAAPPAASAQPAPPPVQPAPPWTQSETPSQSETPMIKPTDPGSTQPTYAVDPPPDSSSGIYLPAAILGYAKSAAGCVVIGCDDGPQVGGSPGPSPSGSSSPGPSSSGSTAPPPADPGPSGPR
jgi:hypothetical protein